PPAGVPLCGSHKGVVIHAGASAKRVRLVRAEIDAIARTSDLVRLFEIAADCSWSPEARLFAGARCIAGLELATERREAKPNIGREDVNARIAGLDSVGWRDPLRYCSLLDARSELAAKRERPLDDDEE